MSSLKDIARAIQKAAEIREASYIPGEHFGTYSKTIQDAANEACSDENDAYLVGCFLFTAWNDALQWAETELAR